MDNYVYSLNPFQHQADYKLQVAIGERDTTLMNTSPTDLNNYLLLKCVEHLENLLHPLVLCIALFSCMLYFDAKFS